MPRTVRIGGRSKPELRAALRERGVRLNEAAETLFRERRFQTLARERLVEVTARSVAEFGFSQGATAAQVVARAREQGLAACPLELGPCLRLQLLDQPERAEDNQQTEGRAPPGSLTVASSPLDDEDETPKGFYLRRVGGVSWLRGYWSDSGHVWCPESVLVFSREPAD